MADINLTFAKTELKGQDLANEVYPITLSLGGKLQATHNIAPTMLDHVPYEPPEWEKLDIATRIAENKIPQLQVMLKPHPDNHLESEIIMGVDIIAHTVDALRPVISDIYGFAAANTFTVDPPQHALMTGLTDLMSAISRKK